MAQVNNLSTDARHSSNFAIRSTLSLSELSMVVALVRLSVPNTRMKDCIYTSTI